METGYQSVRFGIAAYIIPFVFVYSPALILKGTPGEVFLIVIKCIFALGLVAIACSGFLYKNINWVTRCLFCLAALGLLVPNNAEIGFTSWILNGSGFVLAALIFLFEWRKGKEVE